MEFSKEERQEILHNIEDYPTLFALQKRINRYRFSGDTDE